MFGVSAGDTWGISGPAFLAIYAVLFGLSLGAVVYTRSWLWQRRESSANLEMDELHACDISFLQGTHEPDRELAVLVGLLGLERHAVIEIANPSIEALNHDAAELTAKRRWTFGAAATRHKELLRQAQDADGATGLHVLTRLPRRCHPVEACVYGAVEQDSDPRVVRSAALQCCKKTDATRTVVEGGLLADSKLHRRLWLSSLWWAPLIALGVARFVAGANNHKPVGF